MADGPETRVTKARRKVDQNSREFNISLWRIGTGRPGPGGIPAELAALTGFSPESIRSRVADCSKHYPPEPIPSGCYDTASDRRYCAAISRSIGDPETREWLQGITGSQRSTPDHEEPRVSRQRVGGKMISITRDLPKN